MEILKSHDDTLQHSAFKRSRNKNTYCQRKMMKFDSSFMFVLVCTLLQGGIGCLICIGLFPQKSPIIIGSFVERDLQVTASYASSQLCSENIEENIWGSYGQ